MKNGIHLMLLTGLVLGLSLFAPSALAQAGHQHAQVEKTVKAQVVNGVQVVNVKVTNMGYSPASLQLKPGVKTRLIFTRTEDGGCTDTVQFPGLGLKKTTLPLNKPVSVEFTPSKAGTFSFVCGMDMVKGTILVRS